VQVFNLHNQEPCLDNRRLKTCGHFGSAPQVEEKPAAKKWVQVFNLHNQEPCLENRRLKTCGHFDPAPEVKNLRPLWLGTAGRRKTCGHFDPAPQVEEKPAAKKVGAGFQPALA
jgi:hypothetical protein